MKKIELLAPAGTIEAVRAAVFHGADAIYCGGMQFGARAYAGNFTRDEIKEVVQFCHRRSVRLYVTMNTLIFEEEMDSAMEEVDFYYHNDVDALIVQDIGLMDRIRKQYPDFELHASTQMHIHNLSGVQWLKKMGVQRAVLARETPLEKIKECASEGVDLEIFSYGALCVSYSGQCLMSHFTHDRSGNRGMCAQCCRMKYSLMDDTGKPIATEGEYLLSPKDLNALNQLPQLIEAGVHSLKIEGRMKRPEYVALVTKTFREAIDHYYEGKQYTVHEKRLEELKVMFNRKFTEGFLFSQGPTIMNTYRPNHMGVLLGKVKSVRHGQIEIELQSELNQGDGLRILNDKEDIGLMANKIEVDGLLVAQAKAGETVVFYHQGNVNIGDRVVKTTDSQLVKEMQRKQEEYRKIPLKVTYKVKLNEPLMMSIMDEEGHEVGVQSTLVCQQAEKSPIEQERFHQILSKMGDTVYEVIDFSGDFEAFFLPVKEINELRRAAVEKMNDLREKRHPLRSAKKEYTFSQRELNDTKIRAIEINQENQWKDLVQHSESWLIFSQNKALLQSEKINPIYPIVNENNIYPSGKAVFCNELGGLEHLTDKEVVIGSAHLNICNSYALQCLVEQGVDYVMLSHEVDKIQQISIVNAFQRRYNQQAPLISYQWGHRELMMLKYCPVNYHLKDGTKKNCTLCKERDYWLQDQKGHRFLLQGDIFCTQTLLEGEPYENNEVEGSIWISCGNHSIQRVLSKLK